jgi:hypothetical protein
MAGSGASPPDFLALSLLIVNTYRCQEHSANITLAFVGRLFSLAAVMYVDNTDILHWQPSSFIEDEDLVSYVQQATTDWEHYRRHQGAYLKLQSAQYISYLISLFMDALS